MAEKDAKTSKKEAETPIKLLHAIANDTTLPMQVRMDAAKSLLPYTAKKTAETLETFNRNVVVSDERLAALSDDQLRTLIELVTKIAEPERDGEGTPETEN